MKTELQPNLIIGSALQFLGLHNVFLATCVFACHKYECKQMYYLLLLVYTFTTLRMVTGPGVLALVGRVGTVLYMVTILIGVPVVVLRLNKVGV